MRKVPLAAVADVIRGVSFSKEEGDTIQSDGKLPVIRAGSIQDSLLLNEGQIWVPREKIKAHQKIRRDDIVMCTSSGSSDLVGKCAKSEVDFEGSFGAFCAGIRPIESKVSASYLYHFLSSPGFRNWTRSSSGANIKNIRISELAEFEIPLPPLTEQKRIAAILDKADAIRRKRQQAIQLADEFLRSVFLDMFGDPVTNPKGWEVRPVGDICDCIVPGRDKPKSFTGSTPWITTNELNHLGITTKKEEFIGLSEEEIAEVKAKVVPAGSVLMTCVGDLGVVSIAGEDMVINQQLHAFLPSDVVTPSFLSYALAWQKGYMLRMASSTTVPYMNKTVCNSVPVIMPPTGFQEKFEEIVEKATEGRAVMAGFSSAKLFESISQRSFSGEL